MTIQNWGYLIKKLRENRNMEQVDLARRSGISPSRLSRIESGNFAVMTPNTESKLARGFRISIQTLREIVYCKTESKKETPEEILEQLKLATPISVPVYDEVSFHAGKGGSEALEYVYRERISGKTPNNIEGYRIKGDCLSPEVKDKDIIIIDRDGDIDNGNIAAFMVDDKLLVARVKKIKDEIWLENNDGKRKLIDCQISAPVIEIIRKLK